MVVGGSRKLDLHTGLSPPISAHPIFTNPCQVSPQCVKQILGGKNQVWYVFVIY